MSRQNANGEGSVWRRRDGRWSGATYVPTTTGRVERRYVYGGTKREAQSKLHELLDRVEQNVPVGPAGLTVETYLVEWLAHMISHVRPSTYTSYETNVRLHINPRIGKRKLTKLSARDVRLMVDDMRCVGHKPRVIQLAHATLRAALQHAYTEELVPRNVAKLVRVERPGRLNTAEPWSAEEAKKFLEAVADRLDHPMWTVMLMLGLRRSEVCGLQWEHVNFELRTIRIEKTVQRVNGKLRELPTKTRRSTRTVPLPSRCLSAMAAHHAARQRQGGEPGRPTKPTGYVFGTRYGTPLEPRNLTRRFNERCEEFGMRRVRLHDLRHTCVSLLLALRVHPRVVMEIVGHSAIEMTMNVYGHVNLDVQRAALDLLDDELGD